MNFDIFATYIFTTCTFITHTFALYPFIILSEAKDPAFKMFNGYASKSMIFALAVIDLAFALIIP